jgi:hypothetical protein
MWVGKFAGGGYAVAPFVSIQAEAACSGAAPRRTVRSPVCRPVFGEE